MRMVIVLVDDHEGPLPIRPQHSIRRDQGLSFGVFDIACSPKEAMLAIPGFCPLLRQHLCREELRGALLDQVIMVSGKHVVRTPAIPTGRMRCGIRQRMMVVRSFSACSKKGGKSFAQPQCPKYIDRGITAWSICLCIKHGNVRGQSIITPNLNYVCEDIGFLKEIAPWALACSIVVRVMLVRHERQV